MKSLKDLREAKGIKQNAVANYLGVSRQTYAQYEQNPDRMTIEQARVVCEFLGEDPADIFLATEGN